MTKMGRSTAENFECNDPRREDYFRGRLTGGRWGKVFCEAGSGGGEGGGGERPDVAGREVAGG